MLALRTRGLRKRFQVKRKEAGLSASFRSLWKPQWETKEAVRGIDLDVREGETIAFLGPNGAGKSTTIKMLTGILHPTSGEAEVLGFTPWKERERLAFRIGTVFGQKSQLWYHLPPMDTFELISRVYEMKRDEYATRKNDLIERFELGPYLHTPVRKLSLGERMRCEIAASLLHRPKLLFLDEPTIGLDAVVKQRIRELIRERNRTEGTTVFLTSHDAGDVETLCSRAVVIHHGGVLIDEPVDRMKREVLSRKNITLTLSSGIDHEALPAISGAEWLREEGSSYRLTVDLKQTNIERVMGELIGRVSFTDVNVEDPPLEEIIKHVYGMRLEREGEG
ncbi:ABC transporter ATP-binding protein [Cohnella cholangitidis]|uniref:ATP-binding cassette domain-containing protein n=1 Tax=Cohnella cholangitidis TaxID=2598458 RepID=A0A7G5C266_9BACL|nr:ATP-binding cassette domain-containing protein [Cohnella cholangitidis]QMV43300.1 ATP-binding cassette domain-containing protein [Cohnella cholangitidis]